MKGFRGLRRARRAGTGARRWARLSAAKLTLGAVVSVVVATGAVVVATHHHHDTEGEASGGRHQVVLAHDGIGVLTFGTPMTTAIDDIRREFGAPTDDSHWQRDYCAASNSPGRSVTWGDLALLFFRRDDRTGPAQFLGFAYVRTGTPGPFASLTTAEGIGIGATRARVEQADGGTASFAVRDPQGFPPPEILVGGRNPQALVLTLDGNGERARVRSIGAGVRCGE